MSKNKKLGKLCRGSSTECFEIIGILENLILTHEGCRPSTILLEIAKRKTLKAFNKIEKTRKILNLLD